jgi:hypothetical protein
VRTRSFVNRRRLTAWGQENIKVHDWFLRRDYRQRLTCAGFSASRSLLLEQIEHPCANVRLRDFSALCGLRRYRADYGGTLQAASDAGSAALACRADRPAASAILLDSACQNAARPSSPLRRKSSAWRLNDSCIAATSPPVAAPANVRIASKVQLPTKSRSVCFFMASACLPKSVKLPWGA